jgi:hypothetical protein
MFATEIVAMAQRYRIDQALLGSQNAFYDVLGEPTFLNEDEKACYLKLRDAIEAALLPQGLFEFQGVADIARRTIENARFQRVQIAAIRSPVVLAEFLKIVFGENTAKATQVALNYFGPDAKEAEKAAKLLALEGVTTEQVVGHAIVAQSGAIQVLDHLIQSRESSNFRKIKDLKKSQKKRANRRDRGEALQQDTVPSMKRNNRIKVSSATGRAPRIVSSNDD